MNKLINTTLAAAFLAALAPGLAGAADLTIRIDDVKSASGTVMVALYDSEGSFLKVPARASGGAAALQGTNVVIKDLAAGEYAFAIFHDANSNGKMDRNLMGIPTEDYAFSNNALGKMGPPSYASAKFAVPAAGASVRVTLN